MPDAASTTPDVLSREKIREFERALWDDRYTPPDGGLAVCETALALLDAIEAIPPIVYEGIANRHKQIFPDEFEHFSKLAEIARQARRE